MAIGTPSPLPTGAEVLPYRNVHFSITTPDPFPENTNVYIVGNFKATDTEPERGSDEEIQMIGNESRNTYEIDIHHLIISGYYHWRIIVEYPDGRRNIWGEYSRVIGPEDTEDTTVAGIPPVDEDSESEESTSVTETTPNFFRRHWKWLLLAAAAIGGGAFIYKNYSDNEAEKDALEQAAKREMGEVHNEYLFSPKPEIQVSGTVTRTGDSLTIELDPNEIEADNCGKPHPARVVLSDDAPKYLGHGVLESRVRVQFNAHGEILEFELERPLRADENSRPFTLQALNASPSS